MARDEIIRRASYGPNSPVVGRRGARTRQHIVDVTLELFDRHGFHGTSVDDIAKAAGISRATLYQYFESKDQLFVELLEECGSAMMRVVRRLGPLGPTPEGFDNLHWWLGEWAWVYDKYATMFAQWAHVDATETSVRPMVTQFVDSYAERVAGRLETSGVTGVDCTYLAAAVLVVVHRVNYLRHAGLTGALSEDELIDSLAVVIQLVLFPRTPAEVLIGHGIQAAPDSALAPVSRAAADPAPDRFSHLSARARNTVRSLLDAALRTMAVRGYSATNIDDIVAEAGVARGTFYKYFSDKTDMLTVLAREAATELEQAIAGLAHLRPGPQASSELRAWLRRMLPVQRRYVGVVRVWIENRVANPTVAELGREVGRSVRVAFREVLSNVERPYPLSRDVAALVMVSALDRIPEAITDEKLAATEDDVVETVAAFIERGLLNGEPIEADRPAGAPGTRAGRAVRSTGAKGTRAKGTRAKGTEKSA